MNAPRKPTRWQSSDQAIRAVQVAFDVEQEVLEAVRRSAFEHNRSTSDEIRNLLGLPISSRPKRPRLTVSLSPSDYEELGARYDLSADDRLGIKERVTSELVTFAQMHKS
ncbi:hypothetical protein O4G98_15050 [Zoogloeaceae bacterium G21618-S1]|uniref:Uncharacterized protein n=1 Tax=Denitromonas halophila TaxID=1629404 RepID=A0A557QFF9_9RHOO|nr:hypothetical protein [Denitromonas halophila]MCZ4306050.1 hypothetical protein [Zoogloeaceae bacterium G21618-S1]TVO51625.1 hypothetical protein FHP91_19380 [Denitromonas halophila]